MRRRLDQAVADVGAFAAALDLMVLINAEKKFLAAAMTFCNELASRHACGRISLGWLEGQYVRMQAISHMERFEKRMGVVQALEKTMEEALDQGEEIVWPPPKESTAIVRDHAAYAADQSVQNICSLPLRLDGKTVGVLTCERQTPPFGQNDLRHLRLCSDQATRRLADLKRRDRWFGARLAVTAREWMEKLLTVEHMLPKIIGVAGAVALGFLLFGRLPYRVEAPFILRCEKLQSPPAPFDAYIDSVLAEKGQVVHAGDVLLTLDKRDLLLQESAASDELSRYVSEAEKARAENKLAEMRVAMAQADQARASLDLARYRLDRCDVKAPFDGVVVDGDLKERVGAPVKQGELLFKVAQLDQMYAELSVKEQDIQNIKADSAGAIAFASQPRLKFPVEVLLVEPAAQTKEAGNVFIARCTFPKGIEPWWRPGMSGTSKISAGKRSPLWIVSHRTIDYLRLKFW